MSIEPEAALVARSLWYPRAATAELRDELLPLPGLDQVRVQADWSALSRGTESLVFQGAVPDSEHERMRVPFQGGHFGFPVKYGYAVVGTVVDGPPAWRGRSVFVLHPHQSAFVVPVTAVVPVPASVPARRAVLAANMETALNALWDGGALPGSRIAVVGGGVVGALTAWLASRLPGTEVTLVDLRPERAALAQALGVALETDRVRRCEATPSQTSLSREDRIRNMRAAFEPAHSSRVQGSWIIVDDVLTTGATADGVAAVLKNLGAERVVVWAVARATLEGDLRPAPQA